MTLNANEVQVAVDGVVLSGPTSAGAPTNTGPGAPAGFVNLGFVSDDGVTETNAQTMEKIKSWQRSAVVRTTVTEGETTFQLTLLQTNAAVLAEYYGATVGVDGSIVVNPLLERPRRSYIIDVYDGTQVIRTYIPTGQVTAVGDQVFAAGVPIGYEITITAYDNAVIGGAARKWYATLGVATVPSITAVTPSGAGAGAMVRIDGSSFTGAVATVGVRFGGVNATAFTVDDSFTIYATLPAGSAGSAPVIVQNAVGSSVAFPYTRAA